MSESQLEIEIEALVPREIFPIDEPTTWCTCDDCLSVDSRLRGTSPRQLLAEPLVLLNLSPSVLTRLALVHFLPALMLASVSHSFGSEGLRRGLALEVITQAGVLDSISEEARGTVARFLRWAANVEESQGFFAGDYIDAAKELESTGRLEALPGYAVTW